MNNKQPDPNKPLTAPEVAIITHRARKIAELASQQEIYEADIDSLDIIGLFTIADMQYSRCSPSVKKMLLQHSHSAIRNAAYLSEGAGL